ncbi:MAG: L,D-transpeptidase family protein [Lachnospiraceae bacterium]|nr:L,D-transpeptidase family protein [Lachnospiraceae bacterium]
MNRMNIRAFLVICALFVVGCIAVILGTGYNKDTDISNELNNDTAGVHDTEDMLSILEETKDSDFMTTEFSLRELFSVEDMLYTLDEEETTEPEPTIKEPVDTDAPGLPYSVSTMSTAGSTNQIVLVVGDGSLTGNTVYLFEKDEDRVWRLTLQTPGFWGKNGISYHTFEGDKTTPAGVFNLGIAFGNKPNPGTALPWVDVNPYLYWVDDLNSDYYNMLIDSREVPTGWSSAEHLSEIVPDYNYSIDIEVNPNRTRNSTSAIFLHCGRGGTAGCVAVPESCMVTILQRLKPGAKIVIAENASMVSLY